MMPMPVSIHCRLLKHRHPTPIHFGVRIRHCRDDTFHSGFDEGFRARAGPAVMGAGFE